MLTDTLDMFEPHERLLLVLHDLESYRNLQMLNDLLTKGHDASMGSDQLKKENDARIAKAKEEALQMIDDVLFTDYHKVVSKEERGNIYQLGAVGKLNAIYFDPFLN